MKIFIKCLYSKSSITELLWLLLVGLILPLALAVRPHESKETIIAAQVEHCPAPGSVFSPCQVLKPHNHPRVWQCPFHQWGNWGTNWFATSLGSGNDRNEHGHSAFESIPLSTRWLLHYAEEETEARRSIWASQGSDSDSEPLTQERAHVDMYKLGVCSDLTGQGNRQVKLKKERNSQDSQETVKLIVWQMIIISVSVCHLCQVNYTS